MKDPLFYLAGCAAVLALILALVYLDPTTDRRDQVDTLSLGPWVVQCLDNGQRVYLVREARKEVLHLEWSEDLGRAWRYAERASAEVDAERFDGLALSIRFVVAEVAR